MKVSNTIAALALLALPTALSAQTGANATGAAAAEATVQAGLPEAPVRRTIEEGRARGASAAQVERAALAVQARLSSSRDALRSEGRHQPTEAEIIAGAEAIQSGARPSDLRRVRRAAPAGRSVTTSLTVLAELTARGEHPGRAAEAIAGRLRAGHDDVAVAGLVSKGKGAVSGDGAVGTPRVDAVTRAGVRADLLGGASSLPGSLTAGVGGL